MMWRRAETGAARQGFIDMYAACADYVDHATENRIDRMIASGCVLWYWDGNGMKGNMAYRIRDGVAKIVAATPAPGVDGQAWSRCVIRKIRRELDAAGVADWYAIMKPDYDGEHMAEFADCIDRMWHEVQGDKLQAGRRRLAFQRIEQNKTNDDRFEGPGKDRAVPERVRQIRQRRGNR